ncbi:DUF4352 domain-containing protein [Streptomyces sp. NBC_00510]
MHNRITMAAALLLMAGVTTACGSGSDGPAPAPTSRAATAGPSPLRSEGGRWTLGTRWTWVDGPYVGNTTVVSYTQPATVGGTKPEHPAYEWAVAEVKVCNTVGDVFTVSRSPWSVAYADGARVKPMDRDAPGFPRPLFPRTDTQVKGGACVRGNIVFAVREGKRPDRVVYAPDSSGEPVVEEWAVPAK